MPLGVVCENSLYRVKPAACGGGGGLRAATAVLGPSCGGRLRMNLPAPGPAP
jgi:hypothetical protein